jgi:hypothetical protein
MGLERAKGQNQIPLVNCVSEHKKNDKAMNAGKISKCHQDVKKAQFYKMDKCIYRYRISYLVALINSVLALKRFVFSTRS